jgi:hypothetical protein
VCCLDECESILGRLEESISAPDATPSEVATLVSMIPSATMPGNRTLSPWLRQRLDEVAEHHGGKVPMHGRLFAQWLHYAYPRECQFPHVSGTIDPLRSEDMMKNNNVTAEELTPSQTEMKRIIHIAPPVKHRVPGTETGALEESSMWSMHEELVVWHQPTAPQLPLFQRFGYVRGIATLGAALSLTVAGVRSLQPVLLKPKSSSQSKFYV